MQLAGARGIQASPQARRLIVRKPSKQEDENVETRVKKRNALTKEHRSCTARDRQGVGRGKRGRVCGLREQKGERLGYAAVYMCSTIAAEEQRERTAKRIGDSEARICSPCGAGIEKTATLVPGNMRALQCGRLLRPRLEPAVAMHRGGKTRNRSREAAGFAHAAIRVLARYWAWPRRGAGTEGRRAET